MENGSIDSLCRLCEEAPLRLTEIDRYIAEGNFTAEELTEMTLDRGGETCYTITVHDGCTSTGSGSV